MADPYEKSRELIKEATSLKKTDINKAISLTKEAIKSYPNFDYYFKLASYYQLSGNNNEAFSVIGKLVGELDFNDVINYNTRIHQIFTEKAKLLYNVQDWVDYFFSLCFSLWNDLISVAVNGWSKDSLIILLGRMKNL
ncbi:MAG: hypothetical protein GH151_04940 [Bacteroidetes bacterium]|nr:hypothetical protein [Bacteroidota bacterium]